MLFVILPKASRTSALLQAGGGCCGSDFSRDAFVTLPKASRTGCAPTGWRRLLWERLQSRCFLPPCQKHRAQGALLRVGGGCCGSDFSRDAFCHLARSIAHKCAPTGWRRLLWERLQSRCFLPPCQKHRAQVRSYGLAAVVVGATSVAMLLLGAPGKGIAAEAAPAKGGCACKGCQGRLIRRMPRLPRSRAARCLAWGSGCRRCGRCLRRWGRRRPALRRGPGVRCRGRRAWTDRPCRGASR